MSDDDTKKDLIQVINNHIYFYSDINEYSTVQLIKIINELNVSKIKIHKSLDNTYIYDTNDDTDSKYILYLHINSNGGNFLDGLAIFDCIRLSKKDIYVIVEGHASSMASIILLAGKKRFITKNSYILIHELRTFFKDTMMTYSNVTDEYLNTKKFMIRVKKLYKSNTTISSIKLNDLLKKDLYLTAKKALKLGFVNKII